MAWVGVVSSMRLDMLLAGAGMAAFFTLIILLSIKVSVRTPTGNGKLQEDSCREKSRSVAPSTRVRVKGNPAADKVNRLQERLRELEEEASSLREAATRKEEYIRELNKEIESKGLNFKGGEREAEFDALIQILSAVNEKYGRKELSLEEYLRLKEHYENKIRMLTGGG